MIGATRGKTRLWLLLLIGVVATLLGQTHAREIFAPSPHESGVFAAQTQASTGENYDGTQYDALDSLLAANTAGRTNAQLVQNVATRADNWGTRQGLGLGPRAGTLKHGYADELLTRYQNIYGNRGLQTETSWLGNAPATYGTRGSARLDVWEPATGTVFDYKFGNAVLSPSQVNKITTQGPLGVQQVIQVKP
jgi:hypothetical protein